MQDILYQRIASSLEHQISNGTLKTGDKMPSLRTLCQEYGVSMTTAIQAYLELEAKALIVSRPKSGYFVSWRPTRLAVPSVSRPALRHTSASVESLIAKVYHSLGKDDVVNFAVSVPDTDLVPIARLNKELINAMRQLQGGGTEYEEIQGNRKLRRDIARLTYTWGGKMDEDDLVTTAGAMGAISFALMALTKKGDTIAVESPVYFGILQLAKSLGLQVMELPTHPVTGMEPEALKKVLPKIKLCVLVSNFHNPLGSCMPDGHKKEIVRMLADHNIPLIEDDLYGEVYFGNSRPKPCKAFDEAGLVLWCGSVSKTLAPGYRVGWIAPGQFKAKIMHQKLIHTVTSPTITQEAIANFLEKGRYEHHLRKMRSVLHTNSLQFIKAIEEYFPGGTKIGRPQGGFMLWVELNNNVDTAALYDMAIKRGISFAPGRMFSLQDQFNNCMRLSFGKSWSDRVEDGLKQLGGMVKAMQKK